MHDIQPRLLLSVQRALLGAVSPNLRAVICGWAGVEIKLRFVFDGEIAEENLDDVRIVGAEVAADFPAPWTTSEDVARLDYPHDIRPGALDLWAYLRKESVAATGNPY
ncbi:MULTISPECIES: hypothetical protein [Mesorhizobium]|jgi:hypothetical protein|uniref:Uncharacterized protein n=1 Tax=Rhizobium loti TaxID=381 RepID=A0A8E3B823_RHILI|nr:MULTISPECIES: hypothetical protein [Mesorhizobium]PWJ94657.1 hypothetical protein C8D77_1011343 [Mesorhizobium loti]RUX90309.1 hypothetical protein EN993_31140 [Mesorhizobium sp. M7D.F.Ca.US.004.01.2.1]RVA29318.1 hypothetical protein EN935_17055 [Mesorhizobium sp. M7D.F.Ca.US.004.03.1.1]